MLTAILVLTVTALAQGFTPPEAWSTQREAYIYAISAGDITGDGVDDLAWAEAQGAVGLAIGPSLAVTATPLSIHPTTALAADVDGDGLDDVLVGDSTGWYGARGTPTGLSAFDWVIPGSGSYRDLHDLGDVDGDGIDDLALSTLLFYGDPGGPVAGAQLPAGDDQKALAFLYAAGDADQDGYSDLGLGYEIDAFGYFYVGELELHRGGAGGPDDGAEWTWQGTGAPVDGLPDDVDHDGDTELLVVDAIDPHALAEGRLVLLDDLDAGAPTEAADSISWSGYGARSPTFALLGDVDGDGEDEIAAGFENIVHLLGPDGSVLAFEGRWDPVDPSWLVQSATSGDLDGDGTIDLAAAWDPPLSSETTIAYWPGTGSLPVDTGGTTIGTTDTGAPEQQDTGGTGTPGQPDGPTTRPAAAPQGCGCASPGGSAGWAWVAAGAVSRRRMRRRG